MQAALAFMLLPFASGLVMIKEDPKYAYITMWLDKQAAPERVFRNVLSKEETKALNEGTYNAEKGSMELGRGQAIRTSVLEEKAIKPSAKLMVQDLEQDFEDKPKLKKEVQQIPLRPRNSEYHGILDIAKNLREVGSKYPLVVLTNSMQLKNETILAENPNLQLIWLEEKDFLDRDCKIGAGHELHFQKLSIFSLTQFDKLIWLDTDIAFAKNVDYAFNMDVKDGNTIYGQIDDYHCDGREWSPTSGGVCSAMLLLKPSTYHFQALLAHQKTMSACWGDQAIIGSYFNGPKTKALQFKRSTINFARCGKKMGFMDVVHFSGSPDARRVGDPEGWKRTPTGQLVNMTEVKEKAERQAKREKERAVELQAKEKEKKRLENKRQREERQKQLELEKEQKEKQRQKEKKLHQIQLEKEQDFQRRQQERKLHEMNLAKKTVQSS